MLPPKIKSKVSMSAIIQDSAGNSRQYNKARKGNKSHSDQKGTNKTVPIWRGRENLKNLQRRLEKSPRTYI